MSALDRRSNPEAKLKATDLFFDRELKRAFVRIIGEAQSPARPQSNTFAETFTGPDAEQKCKKHLEEIFLDRLFEGTSHPSQIHAEATMKYFYIRLGYLRSMLRPIRDGSGDQLNSSEIDALAIESAGWVRRRAVAAESNLCKSFVPSNDTLQDIQISYLREKMAAVEDRADPQAVIKDLLKNTPDVDAEQGNQNIYDETRETIEESKFLILRCGREIHPIWIDFDGAKRPEGIMFSIYAGLLIKDINFDGNEAEKNLGNQLYGEFTQIDAIIHALTLELQGSPRSPATLEKVMNELKVQRKKYIEQLKQICNQMNSRGVNMKYLSKRIRFLPRFDQKFIAAWRIYKDNKEDAENGDLEAQANIEKIKPALAAFRHIGQQILEIAQISQSDATHHILEEKGTTPLLGLASVVPQVMLAEATGLSDLQAIDEMLADLARELRYPPVGKLAVTPLFESDEMTQPSFIETYLNQVWDTAPGDQVARVAYINEHFNEIFVAGSDLSKRMGQLAARIRVREVSHVILKFNRKYKTDIRLKLGTGETVLRQSGYLDSEGELGLVRGRILDPKEQKAGVQEEQAFLEDIFGDSWASDLTRSPGGFHWLQERDPGINSYTNQSRAREKEVMMAGDQVNHLGETLSKQHQENRAKIAAMSDAEIENLKVSDTLQAAAEAENERYLQLMGAASGRHTKPNGLASLPAIIEAFAKKIPPNRQRGQSRESATEDLFSKLAKLAKPGVDARAIGTNTASAFIFPLAFLGKAAALGTAGGDPSKLGEILYEMPLRDFLREMKLYETIAPAIFALLRGHGLGVLAGELEQEWNALLAFRPQMQAALWQQILPPEAYQKLQAKLAECSSEDEKKVILQRLANTFVPGTRELFIDDFQSDRTQVYGAAFAKAGIPIMGKTFEHLSSTAQLQALFRDALGLVTGQYLANGKNEIAARDHLVRRLVGTGNLIGMPGLNRKMRVSLLAAYRNAKKELEISPEEMGRFLAPMVSAAGRAG